jgi:hypothetical protein
MDYPRLPPLDDLFAPWREHLTERRQLHSSQVAAQLQRALADAPLASQKTAARLVQETLRKDIWPLATEEMLPACLAWLREQGAWPETVMTEDLKPELALASACVPPPVQCIASPYLTYDPYSWVLPGVFGAIIGGLLFGWAGSVLFTLLCLAGLGWLLHRPNIRVGLEVDEQADPEPSSRTPFWARVAISFQVWFARLLIRPYTEAKPVFFPAAQLRQSVDDYYTACANGVLLACWSRVTSQRTVFAAPADKAHLPESLFEAIGVLQRSLQQAEEDPQALPDAAQELLQSFAHEGYAWQSLAPGTVFDKGLLTQFDTYGQVVVRGMIKKR